MRFQITAILIAASALSVGLGQEPARVASTLDRSSLPAVEPPNRTVIGVALEGGGALGLAHIGVLQWLEEHRIPVDRISGTSMGSLIGALYATGVPPEEMRALATSDAFPRVFSLQSPYSELSFRRRQDRRELPQSLTVGLRQHLILRNALLRDRGISEFLTTEFASYNREDLDFDRFPIPFRCLATDLNTLEPVIFSSGPVPLAVRASASIPGVFSPVQASNGHFLVDGGIVDNLPTDVLKRDLHAEIVLAIYLEDAPLSSADTSTIVGVLNRAFDVGIQRNVAEAKRLADVVVTVPVGNFTSTDYTRAEQLIAAGYKAADDNREKLLRYGLDEAGWRTYLANRESRRRSPLGVLRAVHVEGGEPGAVRQVKADLKLIEGKPITPAATLDALKNVQSDGGISATWESFSSDSKTAQPTSTSGPAASGALPPDTGLLVRLGKDRTGPPYLLISPELEAANSNITRGEMTLRLIDQNLGGYGSELRATARVGYKTDLTAEYYRRVAPGGYFIAPTAGFSRAPVYLWANQKRIAERLQENFAAGIEAGRTISSQVQISAEWRAEATRWSLTTGTGGGPYLTGTAQTGLLHIDIDKAAAGAVSPNGFRLSASAGALYHAVGSANAPLVRLSFSRSASWKESNIFGISGEVNSYLRANVAQPFRFTLGGPMRLSASSFDEYRGTDTYWAHTGFLHRIAALPTGLGHGLYGAFGYEAGEIWSPEAKAILRQDGTAGLVANTPLGLVTFGISVGDGGHRKVFVTLGRWF